MIGQVFHALVHILATTREPQFERFQPVIETYISEQFSAALVYKVILSCDWSYCSNTEM